MGECESLPPLTKLYSPSSNISQSMACLPTNWSDQQGHFLQLSPPPAFPAPSIPVNNPNPNPNNPNPVTPNMENNPLPLPPKSHSLNRSGLQPPKRHVRKNPLIVPSAMVSNLIRNENVSTCLYGNSAATTVKSSPVRHFSNPNDQDAFETALEENIDALDEIGGEGGEESLFPDDSMPGKYLNYKLYSFRPLSEKAKKM